MKRVAALFFCLLLAAPAVRAQAVHSATTGQFSVSAGATGSIFQPDYLGSNLAQTNGESIRYGLVGVGTFVDLRFRRWIQVEAEGRWSRFNINPAYANVQVTGTAPTVESLATHEVTESTYLIGPRIPLHRFGRTTPYVKALLGIGRTSLNPDLLTISGSPNFGGFAQAYGGGLDYRLTKHLNIRIFDAEYQSWNLAIQNTANSQTSSFPIHPYGASAGISYKIY
jgi:hypothetical protein